MNLCKNHFLFFLAKFFKVKNICHKLKFFNFQNKFNLFPKKFYKMIYHNVYIKLQCKDKKMKFKILENQ